MSQEMLAMSTVRRKKLLLLAVLLFAGGRSRAQGSLPSGWSDSDVGSVGVSGSASFSGGVFTVQGAGITVDGSTTDAFRFAYQALSGDGRIIARVASMQNAAFSAQAGVMIRETLNVDAANSFTTTVVSSSPYLFSFYRTPAGTGGTYSAYLPVTSFPYWVMLVRTGNTFTNYISADGVNWNMLGTPTSISMAQNVYIGLGVNSRSTSSAATATFDNVSVTAGSGLLVPVITGLSPTFGGLGSAVTITGSHFGSAQGSSSVKFSGAAATTINSWSDGQIVAIVPNAATTGHVAVVVNAVQSNATTASSQFTVYNPIISSLSPPAAPVGGSIILQGSGFGSTQGTSSVKINAATASVTSWSDTSVTVTVPSGATSGTVSLTESGITSNTVPFNLLGSISISGVAPTSGWYGTPVQISGANFGSVQSNSTVTFNGAPAAVTSWSDTQILVTVPQTASSGAVAVKVAGLTQQGSQFALGMTALLTDSLGHQTSYTSQPQGGVWRATDAQGSGCSSCTVRGNLHNTFDAAGNLLTATDALGHTTTYTYDSSNNVLSQAVQLNSTTTPTTSYTYNSVGQVLTVTDALGHATTNTYDAHGNLTSVTTPVPGGGPTASVTQFGYNSLGELTTITDPLGHATTLAYTAVGLIHTITDAQSNVTTYGYDAHGNRTSVTDALSHTTTFAYDTGDRLTTITYPDSTSTTFTYDNRGRRTSVTDQNGKTTTYSYDDADRLTSVTDAASHVTSYAYDTESNLTSITDANGHQTLFTYDAYRRVTQTNFPSSHSESYAYDADNNLTSKTDRNGHTISYVYDALNRLTSKIYPDSTEVDYVYDLVGKIQQVNDPTGTYAFAYDNMGRLLGTTTNYSFLTSRSFTTAYTYDLASNRTGFTDPESGSTSYAYDTLNRLTTLTPPSVFTTGGFGFSYDALSRRTQMTRPNGVASNYTYDNLSRLLSVLHQLSSSTIDGASYTVDNAGNRTAKTDWQAGVTTNYGYDSIYQLLSATQGATTTESYTYDPVGNRLSSLGVASYSNNSSNELTSTSNASYTYDYNGNPLTRTVGTDTTTYSWDYENRLTSVALPGSGGTVSFRYDPFARRIYKSSSSSTNIYAYDGDNLIEETNSSGIAVARYSQGLNIDEPLAMLRSSTTTYYHADGLGSVTSLSNGAGSLAQTYGYDSFGKQTSSSGSLTNPLQYTAHEFDTETSLEFSRERYYDPTIGRFISADPLAFEAGPNFYSYISNDPLNYADPFGLSPADVQRILNQAQNLTDQMTRNGERVDWGYWNNFRSSLQRLNPFRKKPPLKGCGEQTDAVTSDLQFPKMPYDDHWTFQVENDGPFHQRGRAISSNPKDPDIIYDPWKNQFFTVPKGHQ